MPDTMGKDRQKRGKRYDKEEDRANDIKLHDNKNHPSKRSHDKKLEEAKEKEKEQN